MKKIALLLCISFLFVFTISCEDAVDNPVPSALQVKDFVWKGMNLYYLWQADVPDLADNRFATQTQLNVFLETYENPTTLFNGLRTDAATDRFSVIFSDYTVLEGVLAGNTTNNGMDFALQPKAGSATDLYGWVRYVLPNSDAAAKNITRGVLFYAVNGTPLTRQNYSALLANDTYTINLADYNNGAITPNGESISLTKTVLQENPIQVNSVITQGTKKIGYLVYNGFYPSFDTQLNTVFGDFQAQGITHLVLDLRYNSGGSVATATKLASMITGQFTNQVFAKQVWNAKAQAYFQSSTPEALENKFVGGLNSLNLTKVYILTSYSSASASELVINSLKPYIDVIQIGDTTRGKNVGSITLYDSPTFTKTNRNPNHKYAMQPIVLKIADKNEFGDYADGLVPNVPLLENLGNLSQLGNPAELLLSAAITHIVANGRMMPQNNQGMERNFSDSKALSPLRTEMYVEQH